MAAFDERGGTKYWSSPDICVSVATTEAAFLDLRDEWDRLLDHSAQSVFFLRWHWNLAWWRHLVPTNSSLFLITCRDTHGVLIGLAPFFRRSHRFGGITYLNELLFLGTGRAIKTSEYLDIIVRRGYERRASEAIARFLRQQSKWDRLWLWGIPAQSSSLPHLRRELGFDTKLTLCDRSRYIDTTVDWETFRGSLGKSLRTNISYYTRRMQKNYVCKFECVETLEAFGPAMKAFIALHQARWQSKGAPGSFSNRSFEAFLTDVMRDSMDGGCLRLWTLTVDQKVSAVLVGFLHNGVLHYFQSGFEPNYAKDSIGTVMLGLSVKRCFEAREVREFDFMGGESTYKDQWTTATRDIVEFEALRAGYRSNLYRIATCLRHITARTYRTIVPAPIRKAFRKALGTRRLHPLHCAYSVFTVYETSVETSYSLACVLGLHF